MQRRIQKPSVARRTPVEEGTNDVVRQRSVPKLDNPFVTFSEWSSEVDEKAYASL
jgi:hypothetical protein